MATNMASAREQAQKPAKRGRPKKSAAEKSATRQKIVKTASTLFKAEGFEAISMRRIAKELKLSPMALYAYFPTKLAILSRLWIEILEEVGEEMRIAADKLTDAEERLIALSMTYVSYWLERRDYYHIVFMSSGLTREDVTEFVREGSAVAQFDPFFIATAEAMHAEQDSPAVKLKTDQLICGLHGIMHCLITVPGYSWSSANALVTSMVKDIKPVSRIEGAERNFKD
ncbi:MAG: TetR/AcrR family transcriptional regulator [Pseudomonadota bacterium]